MNTPASSLDAPEKLRVFISYAREDSSSADRLYKELKGAGYAPWLDTVSLLPGQFWESEVQKAIRECDCFIALLSSHSVPKKGYVQKELRDALAMLEQVPESKIFLIPARLDNCSPLPERLRKVQRVDLFPRWEEGMAKLLAALFHVQSLSVGTPSKPLEDLRRGSLGYVSLADRIRRLGVTRTGPLGSEGILGILATPLIVDDVVLDAPILSYEGVKPSAVVLSEARGWEYPSMIDQVRQSIPMPDSNRPKVVLVSWRPPLSDEGYILGLSIARTDFWSCISVEKATAQIHEAVLAGTLSLRDLPRQFVCHAVVTTADNQLLLCLRSDGVRYYKRCWSASFEESIDWDKDASLTDLPDPARTLERAMGRKEELGLPKNVVDSSIISYVAIGTEWSFLSAPVFCIVHLPNTDAIELIDHCRNARDQEHIDWDTVPFNAEALAPILRAARYEPNGRPKSSGSLHGTSRIRILLALFHVMGIENALSALEAV